MMSTWLWFLQDPEQLQENGNQILTAIIQGMRKEEPSNNVKLAATNALLNSLEFTKGNFDKEVRRHRGICVFWGTGRFCLLRRGMLRPINEAANEMLQ